MINGAPVIEETERNLQNIHLLCIFICFQDMVNTISGHTNCNIGNYILSQNLCN
jgi:hypothetical protein